MFWYTLSSGRNIPVRFSWQIEKKLVTYLSLSFIAIAIARKILMLRSKPERYIPQNIWTRAWRSSKFRKPKPNTLIGFRYRIWDLHDRKNKLWPWNRNGVRETRSSFIKGMTEDRFEFQSTFHMYSKPLISVITLTTPCGKPLRLKRNYFWFHGHHFLRARRFAIMLIAFGYQKGTDIDFSKLSCTVYFQI